MWPVSSWSLCSAWMSLIINQGLALVSSDYNPKCVAWYTQVFTAYVLEHLHARYNMMNWLLPESKNMCYQLSKELISWYQADLSTVVCSAWTFCSWMTQEFQDSESELCTLSFEFEESITSCFVPCKHCKKPKRKFCHCPFNNNKTSLMIIVRLGAFTCSWMSNGQNFSNIFYIGLIINSILTVLVLIIFKLCALCLFRRIYLLRPELLLTKFVAGQWLLCMTTTNNLYLQ